MWLIHTTKNPISMARQSTQDQSTTQKILISVKKSKKSREPNPSAQVTATNGYNGIKMGLFIDPTLSN